MGRSGTDLPSRQVDIGRQHAKCASRVSGYTGVVSVLEEAARETRLTDDAGESADFEFLVIWNGHRRGGVPSTFLHDDVAAALTNFREPFGTQD